MKQKILQLLLVASLLLLPGITLAESWILSGEAARKLIEENNALVLDARADNWKNRLWWNSISNSVAVKWRELSDQGGSSLGKVSLDQSFTAEVFKRWGVHADQPVVVIADAEKGWGEDGRIVWSLRTLGHQQAYLVDGGFQGLKAAGAGKASKPRLPGSFTAQPVEDWHITAEQIRNQLGQSNLVLIDTRESREFAGETPYGESRGGHIPGSVHLHYRELTDAKGRLLPENQIRQKLQQLGVNENSEVIAYCTGGVRAGWFTSVLHDLGYTARNYDGSMWDWSSRSAAEFPLTVR